MGGEKRRSYRRADGTVMPGSLIRDNLADEIESHRDATVRCSLLAAFRDMCNLSLDYCRELTPHLRDIVQAIPTEASADEAPDILRSLARLAEKTEDGAVRKKRYRVLGLVCLRLAGHADVAGDPHMAWIAENRELILSNLHCYRIIAHVMANDVSLFREMPDDSRRKKNGGIGSLVEFDTGERWVQDLVLEVFSGKPKGVTKARKVASSFAESLSGDVPQTPSGLTAEHLVRQLEHFADDEMATRGIEELYIHLLRTRRAGGSLGPAQGVTLSYLENPKFVQFWRDGFRAVLLNPLDPVPAFDRWHLFPNGTEDAFAAGKPNRGHSVDFMRVDRPLREAAKCWFWHDDVSLVYRKQKLHSVCLFLEWRREGPRFVSLDESFLVGSEEVELYLLGLQKRYAKDSMAGTKTALRSFFEFLGENHGWLIDPLCLHIVNEFCGGKGCGAGKPAYIPPEDFEALETAFRERSSESPDGMIRYAAFMILAYTPIRGASIFDLKLSHIQESARPGQHVVRQPSKTTGRDSRDLGIHPKIKRVIDQVIIGTSPCREVAPEDLRDYVFLTNGMKGAVVVYSDDAFRKYLSRLCGELGLPAYNRRSIRSWYMTRASDAGMGLGMDPDRTREATGHASVRTDEKHYINRPDREYYEALYGVEIGTAKIAGALSLETPPGVGEPDLVSGGAGYCSSDSCSLDGAVSCLLCRHFRTTPRHIPRMKEAVADIDRRIMAMGTDHDRGHLAARKRLYVAYICALEELRREAGGR